MSLVVVSLFPAPIFTSPTNTFLQDYVSYAYVYLYHVVEGHSEGPLYPSILLSHTLRDPLKAKKERYESTKEYQGSIWYHLMYATGTHHGMVYMRYRTILIDIDG